MDLVLSNVELKVEVDSHIHLRLARKFIGKLLGILKEKNFPVKIFLPNLVVFGELLTVGVFLLALGEAGSSLGANLCGVPSG